MFNCLLLAAPLVFALQATTQGISPVYESKSISRLAAKAAEDLRGKVSAAAVEATRIFFDLRRTDGLETALASDHENVRGVAVNLTAKLPLSEQTKVVLQTIGNDKLVQERMDPTAGELQATDELFVEKYVGIVNAVLKFNGIEAKRAVVDMRDRNVRAEIKQQLLRAGNTPSDPSSGSR